VDDRALNRHVLAALPRAASLLEIACGTGTMFDRLAEWELIPGNSRYLGVDADPQNIAAAQAQPRPRGDVTPSFLCADLFDLTPPFAPGLLIACAFLDLLDIPAALARLTSFLRPGAHCWFPINFDGETIFHPAHPLDHQIIPAYHATMRTPQAGRLLFKHLPAAGIEILAAGASDWVVHPTGGAYPADEACFLRHILHFFETSLAGHPALAQWLAARLAQLARAELTFIAHQLDFAGIFRGLR
jgi:SAM-dependent methyltransferase